MGGPRPITLLFARSADAEGVREALQARRTAAWLGDDVWGAEEHLRGLWQGALGPWPTALSARPGQRLALRGQNASAIPYRLRPRSSPRWLGLEAATVQARATSLIYLAIAGDAPTGRQRVALEVEVTNLHIGPGRPLVVTLPLEIAVAP